MFRLLICTCWKRAILIFVSLLLPSAPLVAVQCAKPISDSELGRWSEGKPKKGNANRQAWDELDEGIVCGGLPDNDTSYWDAGNNPDNTNPNSS